LQNSIFSWGQNESGDNPQGCRQEDHNFGRWRCHADRIAVTVDQTGGGIDNRACARGTVCHDDHYDDPCTDDNNDHNNNNNNYYYYY
jgi:hypothetical protein